MEMKEDMAGHCTPGDVVRKRRWLLQVKSIRVTTHFRRTRIRGTTGTLCGVDEAIWHCEKKKKHESDLEAHARGGEDIKKQELKIKEFDKIFHTAYEKITSVFANKLIR